LGKGRPDDYAVLPSQSGTSCGADVADAQFLHFMRAQIEGMPVHADAFAVMFGSDEFTERMKRRQAQLASPLARRS